VKLRFILSDYIPSRYGTDIIRSHNRDDGHACVVQLGRSPDQGSISILVSTEAVIELATCDGTYCGQDDPISICFADVAFEKARRKSTFVTYLRKGRLIWRDYAPEYGVRMRRASEQDNRFRSRYSGLSLVGSSDAAFASIVSDFDEL
jgi:hypothetical protein